MKLLVTIFLCIFSVSLMKAEDAPSCRQLLSIAHSAKIGSFDVTFTPLTKYFVKDGTTFTTAQKDPQITAERRLVVVTKGQSTFTYSIEYFQGRSKNNTPVDVAVCQAIVPSENVEQPAPAPPTHNSAATDSKAPPADGKK